MRRTTRHHRCLAEGSVNGGDTIRDNGYGIPGVDRSRIFKSFYQGDVTHVGVGTGMGLAICKAIAKAHNGSISLETDRGHRS